MKIIYAMTLVFFWGCGAVQKDKGIEICSRNSFYQKVEKASFENTDRLKELNGKFIEIEGIFHGYFEDVALYPSLSSHADGALWLDLRLPEPMSDSLLQRLNKGKVIVTGRVNFSEHGHLGAYMARLDSVFCIKEIK